MQLAKDRGSDIPTECTAHLINQRKNDIRNYGQFCTLQKKGLYRCDSCKQLVLWGGVAGEREGRREGAGGREGVGEGERGENMLVWHMFGSLYMAAFCIL